MTQQTIRIDGEVEHPIELTADEIVGLPVDALITDVSQLEERRQGEAVRLAALLDQARPKPEATYLTLHSCDGFSASIPLEEVRDSAVLIYRKDSQPLQGTDGGPLRFLIPQAAACKTAEVDTCANVKGLARIELSVGKGADTR